MAEDHRVDPQSATSGVRESQLGLHVRCGGLQLGTDADTARFLSWRRMSAGTSVPACRHQGRRERH